MTRAPQNQSAPVPTLGQRVAEQAVAGVAWVRGVSIVVKLILVAGGALVAGLARVLPLATTPFDIKDFVGAAGLVAVFLGGVALIFLDKSLADSLKLAADAAAELERVRATAASLGARFQQAARRDAQSRALRAASAVLRGGVERAFSRHPPDEDATVSELLDVALNELHAAMGFAPGELWTVSVYRAAPGPLLVIRRVATRRANRREEAAPSREWLPGEGHIGMTFLRAEEVVLEDVTDPAIRHALNTPAAKDRSTDATRYRSIAAVPVIPHAEAQPWGVVIATSALAGWFSPVIASEGWERAEAMRVFAGMIALAVSAHHIVSTPRP